MGWTLVVLLVILHFSTTVSVYDNGDDFATKALPCRRCKFYSIKVATVGAAAPIDIVAAAPPDEESSGKKTNVGAVVGLTFLLVFILVAGFVFIYRNRRSGSSLRSSSLQPAVVQPAQAQEVVQQPVREGLAQQGDVRGRKKKEVPREVEPKGRVQVVGKDDDIRKVARPERLNNVRQGEEIEERRDKKKKEVVGDVIEPKREVVRPQGRRGDAERQRQKQFQIEKVVGKDGNIRNVVRARKMPNNGGQGEGIEERIRDEKKKKGVAGEVIEPKGDGREGKRRGQAEEFERKAAENENEERRDDKKRKGVVEEMIEAKREELRKQRKLEEDVKGKKPQEQGNSFGLPKKYDYKYLVEMTNGFSSRNWLGGGTYGKVYKGTLRNGIKVAVKCLIYGGRKEDFLNEVDVLSRADHPNLVKLLGYCDDSVIQILVYEYAKNGPLEDWIFGYHNKSLTWPEMKNIILGIAQGLEYFHEKCDKKILHRDLKPANIVLDGKKNAKLCDFGFVKQLSHDQSSISAPWAGTPAYMAPEAKIARASAKLDIYSFGVVVLEVIFGKRYPYLVSVDRTNNTKQVKLHVLIKNLGEDMRRNGKEIIEFGKLALCCLRENKKERPPMSVVVTTIRTMEARFKEAEARKL